MDIFFSVTFLIFIRLKANGGINSYIIYCWIANYLL
jgi:hypothetical protein